MWYWGQKSSQNSSSAPDDKTSMKVWSGKWIHADSVVLPLSVSYNNARYGLSPFSESLEAQIQDQALSYGSGTRHTVAMEAGRLLDFTVRQCLMSGGNSAC